MIIVAFVEPDELYFGGLIVAIIISPLCKVPVLNIKFADIEPETGSEKLITIVFVISPLEYLSGNNG